MGIIIKNLLPSQNPTGNPVPRIRHNFHVCDEDNLHEISKTVMGFKTLFYIVKLCFYLFEFL